MISYSRPPDTTTSARSNMRIIRSRPQKESSATWHIQDPRYRCATSTIGFFQSIALILLIGVSNCAVYGDQSVGLDMFQSPANLGLRSALARYSSFLPSSCSGLNDSASKKASSTRFVRKILSQEILRSEAQVDRNGQERYLNGGSQSRFALAGRPSNIRDSLLAIFPRKTRRYTDPHNTSSQPIDLFSPCSQTSLQSMSSKPLRQTKKTAAVEEEEPPEPSPRPLMFWETMICGAISRSVAQTVMHPANTMKTILQNSNGPALPIILTLLKPSSFHRLTYGAGTNFLLSVPNGALNFSVLEFVRKHLGNFVASTPYLAERADHLNAGLDFLSSSLSTVVCSIVATPQMMITDNIMAGNYPNLFRAAQGLAQSGGIRAFYRGWLPGIVGKIPSYALTWTLFQRFKKIRDNMSDRPATHVENSIMGVMASTTTVCIMIPLDTIKTRIVTQGGLASVSRVPYKGIIDCAVRVMREEGVGAFYRGLPPRLVSVVPMIGIQFGVYEAMKKVMRSRPVKVKETPVQEPVKVKGNGEPKVEEEILLPPVAVPDEHPDLFEDVEEVALFGPRFCGPSRGEVVSNRRIFYGCKEMTWISVPAPQNSKN